MHQSVDVRSGDIEFSAALDFNAMTWSSQQAQPEAEFPVPVHVDGKRYELYSDGTFAEVEGGIG
jgi:hypothetical protein